MKLIMRQKRWNLTVKPVLIILFLLLLFALGSVVISDGGEIIANLGNYIIHLFHIADPRPGHAGFDKFFQLMAIAVFVGWAIRRFIKMK